MKVKITIVTLLILLIAAGCTYSLSSAANDNTIKDITAQAKELDLVAKKWEQKKLPDSAFYYYNASQIKYLDAKDYLKAANTLLKMAQIQYAAGDYPGSEISAMKSLYISKNFKDLNYLLNIYKHLGATHRELSNNDKAIFYYEKAYQIEKDTFEILKLQSTIARVYIAKSEYTTALQLLNKAKKSGAIDSDPIEKAAIIDRIGYSYFKQGNNSALKAMNEAMEIRQHVNDINGLVLSYLHLSEFYNSSDPDNAKLYALKAYAITWQSSNYKRKLRSLLRLIAVSDGKDADMYSHHYAILKNDADHNTQTAENKFKKMLDNAARNADNPEDIAKLEVSKDNNKILTLALMASVFSSVLLFYQLTQRHKKERLLDAYAAETRLSKKIHDEIANELYGTLHYIEHEDIVSGSKKEKLIEQLDNIYLMTRNISRENNDIDTGLRFPVQLKLMLATYSNNGVNVIVKGISKINWEKIESIKKIATYRVLQELMVNMDKHSKATVVLIDFSSEKNKVKIIYSDNGIGTDCPKINLKNGLQNVENRMVSIGGSISFDTKSEKGFHLTLTYPLPILYV